MDLEFTAGEGSVAAVPKDVNAILAAEGKRPLGSIKKLEQEVANRERQIARLTARLDKVADSGGLEAIFDKVAEMEQELKAKRAELAEQQRLNRRPPVKRVKEKDVTAALTQLRQLLLSDVGLPDLRPAKVYAALAFFHDHHDSMVAAIEAGKARAERARGPETVSRDELLRSRSAAQSRNG